MHLIDNGEEREVSSGDIAGTQRVKRQRIILSSSSFKTSRLATRMHFRYDRVIC